MASQCPICSRTNPAEAYYCYFDGGALSKDHKGPLQVGSLPFPMKFFFSDGQSCGNFNQLALACNNHWDEARELLVDDMWPNFFRAMGRLDLAAIAKQAASEPDRDYGLCLFLEKLPTDLNVLRPPKLALEFSEVNLGQIAPGVDRVIDVTLFNQGMYILHGTISTNCPWLAVGDGQWPASRMLRTRNSSTISVRVLGEKLRAGREPLHGEIVIETNGGIVTVPVRATIPITPFPKGKYANDALAGAKSPREIALKARSHPNEAGVLFEQLAVKSWYESNGWTYPVEGSPGSGKAAVQQFFEALGLTKPPRLEISHPSLSILGEVGQRLSKVVTIGTKEAKAVYAQGWSNQEWVTVGQPTSKGNRVAVPIKITVPRRPGETHQAIVTIQGNGRQRFQIPVTLKTVAGENDETASVFQRPRRWIFAGVGLVLFLAVGLAAFFMRGNTSEPAPLTIAQNPNPVVPEQEQKKEQKKEPPVFIEEKPLPQPLKPPVPLVPLPPSTTGQWWARIEKTRLPAAVLALKQAAPAEHAMLDRLGTKLDLDRFNAYQDLLTKAPTLAGLNDAKEPLGHFLADGVLFDPVETNATPLRRWLVRQIPLENTAFDADTKVEDLDRAFWALQVGFDALNNTDSAVPRGRIDQLAEDLGGALGLRLNAKASADRAELNEQAERLLAMRCYRNTVPTADKSVNLALSLRAALIQKAPKYLAPEFREKIDVDLVAIGLSKGGDAWPKLEPILRECLESGALTTNLKIVDLYEGADAAMAKKVELVLAEKWKVAADGKFERPAKAKAIRTILTRNPAERAPRLQKLATTTLAAVKPGAKQDLAALLDTVRLAHASTMACTLFQKGPALDRFDDLVGKVPEIDIKDANKPKDAAKDAKNPDGITVGMKPAVIQGILNNASERENGSLRKVYVVNLKGNTLYSIDLTSSTFSLLRIEDLRGFRIDQATVGGGRINGRIFFQPPEDGAYRLVVSNLIFNNFGTYILQIRQGAGGPVAMQPLPEAKKADETDPQAVTREIPRLENKQADTRISAFNTIATNFKDDLSSRQAQLVAKYLLSAKESEIEAIAEKLGTFATSRSLMLSLADGIFKEEGVRNTAELVVSGVLERKIQSGAFADWRTPARKMLLQKALELTVAKNNGADEAAEFLRESYREQGVALGMDEDAFKAMTRPSQVLASVAKHVATLAAAENLGKQDKEYLDRFDRRLEVAQFLANSDLERTALLQRACLKALTIYLQHKAPANAEAMARLQRDLAEEDRRSPGVIDQLRAGEEKSLRLWMLANDLK